MPVLLPGVPAILETGWTLVSSRILFGHLFANMARPLVGFAIGTTVGIIIGLCMGLSRRVECLSCRSSR